MPNILRDTGLRWLWITVLALVLDQVTKIYIQNSFALYERLEVTFFFNITHVHNYGAAFSFLSDAGGWQRWFFTAIAIAVSALMLWWMKQAKREQLLLPISMAFILSGALGNLYDRLAYGYVVDFLDFHWAGYHWPAFNVADSAIFIGAALMIWDAFKNPDNSPMSGKE
ncbi:MAG: lipoprotein signal peptidase [Alteromonadaceae bacterium]|nr:lipoprotein signal peptidase [Alteromonadaceae bacterium]